MGNSGSQVFFGKNDVKNFAKSKEEHLHFYRSLFHIIFVKKGELTQVSLYEAFDTYKLFCATP